MKKMNGITAVVISPPEISHECVDGVESTTFSWWEHDGQGIPLCRVCEVCKREKLARYRPEILRPYTQADVDEPIEED